MLPEGPSLLQHGAEATPTSDTGIVGHAHTANTIVGHSSHFSRTPCAVPARVKSTVSVGLTGHTVHFCTTTTIPHTYAHGPSSTQEPTSTRPVEKASSPLSGAHFSQAQSPSLSYLLSFICVYLGCGSGSWSLTSKLAPGSWTARCHGQEQADPSSRPGQQPGISIPHPPPTSAPPWPPHIIACQVRVVLLNAVIQNGNHNAVPCEALGPGFLHVQVPLGDTRLQTRTHITCVRAGVSRMSL